MSDAPAYACDQNSALGYHASGYKEPRGYDGATLKLFFSLDGGTCVNRFTYDSKLAPSPEVSSSLVPSDNAEPAKYQLAKFVVTDILHPAEGKHCASASVDLGESEVIGGSPEPPATSQLVCLGSK